MIMICMIRLVSSGCPFGGISGSGSGSGSGFRAFGLSGFRVSGFFK